MNIRFCNFWHGNISLNHGCITIFYISWQFDEYYKGINIILFNFLIDLSFKEE